MDGRVVLVDELNAVCWCCGGIRLKQHIITWEDKLYDYVRTLCFPPYIAEPCPFAFVGSSQGVVCPFKDREKSACLGR